jgi:hypothetical protein
MRSRSACRTPENIVVNLPDVEAASLAGYRRRCVSSHGPD